MKWNTLAVEAEMGCKDGLPCSICKKTITDLIWFPTDSDEFIAKLTKMSSLTAIEILNCDDYYVDFYVCDECKDRIDKLIGK